MAANTDLLKKLSRRWVGQIGSGGVSDASVTTIPLSSTTNLPTDTAVVATIDRVDSNGTATSSLEETVIGVVSGSNLVSCTRGVEGTAQAHSAGAVVEILVTAKGINDIIDHLLVQHDQLGRHTNITACNVTASGTTTASHVSASDITALHFAGSGVAVASEVTTGTAATKVISPDALSGSNYGKKVVELKLASDTSSVASGDGKFSVFVPSELNGWNLVDADAAVSTVSSSGTPTYQIRNVTQTADMLSTRITIDANEKTSYTAATPPVIDANNDDVATGDEIAVDKDVAGTGEKGDTIILTFQLP